MSEIADIIDTELKKNTSHYQYRYQDINYTMGKETIWMHQ